GSETEGERTGGALAELSRRPPDVPAQRTGQVRLVEVREPRNNLGERDAVGQECRSLAYAFDLPYGALSEPGRRSEPAFDGASRDPWTVASAAPGDERGAGGGSRGDETGEEGLSVVGAGRLPADAVQPKGPARGVGELGAPVDKGRRG